VYSLYIFTFKKSLYFSFSAYFKVMGCLQVFINFARLQTDLLDDEISAAQYRTSPNHGWC